MPNYCECEMDLRGPIEEVSAALELIGATGEHPDFNFDAVIPYPDPFRSMDAEFPGRPGKTTRENYDQEWRAYRARYGTESDGYNSGGYEWCIENWGTKWSASAPIRVHQRNQHSARVSFRTAWSAPVPVVVALARRFPLVTVELHYFERGAEVCGGFTVYSVSDAEDYEEQPGVVARVWTGKYKGSRGG
jgi:hypothetical protein